MGLEQKVNQQLNKYPAVKKTVKSIYQHINYAISSKEKYEGKIIRLSPNDPSHEYFFGYYDKSPWDVSGRYVLCLKAKNTWSDTAPLDPAEILVIDTKNNNEVKTIAITHSWNVQQGCMLQWLGPDFDRKIIFNDFRNGKFCSVIKDVFSGTERVCSVPVYSVSLDGKFALTLDFTRLHRMRPGYGYSNLEETTRNQKIPDGPCIWKLNIEDNTVKPVLNYIDFASFEPRPEMKNAEHKVNHIMISPNGERFMVLHRWFDGQRKYSRLVTANVDGTEMYNLSDDDMVSHCNWKDNQTIIAFENKKNTGVGYYLMKDKSNEYRHLWPYITSDGHPSYSPDGKLVVTDTYPNRKRMALIKILNDDFNVVVAKVFAPFKYDNDTRCDLHPRWSRDGKSICFDSAFEGHRGLYMIPLNKIKFAYSDAVGTKLTKSVGNKKRIRVLYLMTSFRKSGPTQVIINIIKNLDQKKFDPVLVTLYDEQIDSDMAEVLPYVSAHYLIKTGKKAIIIGKTKILERVLTELHPDIIHSTGVFPEFAVAQMKRFNLFITLHNFMFDDYLTKYGKMKGMLLAKMELSAVRKSEKVVTCSESLSKIYKEKLGLSYEFIRNGVDIEQYSMPVEAEKRKIRKKLSLPENALIFVYTGQFIERKNVPFLVKNYVKVFGNSEKIYLLLLGAGPELDGLQKEYQKYRNVDFRGNVSNISYYLKACDVYISTSKSEGLPNGVLEAMATGLPVILSNIAPHKEIINIDAMAGVLYDQEKEMDFIEKLELISESDVKQMGTAAYNVVHQNFNAYKMSIKYQECYEKIYNEKISL